MQETIRRHYLKVMGVNLWLAKDSTSMENQTQTCIDNSVGLLQLKKLVADCTKCELHKSRKQTVFGVGNEQAELMIIGEAPGFNEDQQGEPFVGRAGKLLDAMLVTIGLSRQQVYIANILKCRPPENRDPTAFEVAQCTHYLESQIQLIQPKLLLALGRVAAHYLLGVDTPLSRLRGQNYQFGSQKVPLLVTYHPAYLLRNPREKAKAFKDLQHTSRYLHQLCSSD